MIVDRETGWTEPEITINGRKLTFPEAMSVRVAVSSFRMFCSEESNAKNLGERLAAGYDHHLASVEDAMRGEE